LGPAGCVREFKCDDWYYHALAYREGCPVFRPGETACITRRQRQVYFDVEDISVIDAPSVSRPHPYMLGAATRAGDTRIWTAHGEDDEARMWTDFLDWLGDPSDVALYCWSSYEFGKLDQAANDHPQLAARLLAAKEALIDLKEEIKGRPCFPVATYSIKSVAPLCGFHWSQDDVDGQSAQLMYLDWLKTGDRTIIERVERYNRDDVLAMVEVDKVVMGLSAEWATG
jgi:predicted RecB family nuclease